MKDTINLEKTETLEFRQMQTVIDILYKENLINFSEWYKSKLLLMREMNIPLVEDK